MPKTIKLTQFSSGAGWACKLGPEDLNKALSGIKKSFYKKSTLGFESFDDCAVYEFNNRIIIQSLDFFTPIVDDPYTFGQIVAANSLSDIYAMGGTPLMAIAVLGWPLEKLPPAVAGKVLKGSRAACARAGIPLAGGHSIDAPEPIFGLAVTGLVAKDQLKRNDAAIVGCELFLTKPLGVGLVTTAQKRSIAEEADVQRAVEQMVTHVFPLEQYQDALSSATNRRRSGSV